ncbi:MAG: ACT domain-containing protein [Kiritimatiellae bacterium]|nr:ACT domain-containing protein [Kiritimatiellia bacterium]MDD4737012.1 ACT domain-containing protein [Kiritimatiellia bacterium]
MTKQINVFVENKPGRFKKITGVLAENGVNIRAIEIQDRGDYGIMKLLVNDPLRAHVALTEAGLAAALRDVIAIAIKDQPGELFKLAELFEACGINMLDAYGFVTQAQQEAIWCVEVEDPSEVTRVVTEAGYRVLVEGELYES